MICIARCPSPLGELLLAADDAGLTGLRFAGSRPDFGPVEGAAERPSPFLDEARRWLDIYFSGRDPGFTPTLRLAGSGFRVRVWELLLGIPYGQATTYGEIARRIAVERGLARMSAQAVGGAVASNPIPLIVPCHRVLGTGGSLLGYSGGLERKAALLRLEGIPYYA